MEDWELLDKPIVGNRLPNPFTQRLRLEKGWLVRTMFASYSGNGGYSVHTIYVPDESRDDK